MNRLLLFAALLLAALGRPAAAADVLPRPKPFTFVTDQANLLNANDAKKLENGLRKYADTYGTQVVLVTVPTLGGTSAADYARQLGTSWGVGQKDKNNGIVVLLSGQEHQMSIEAGSGLRSVITPELTRRVIRQEMTPAFKQGNYFAGLSKGLGSLMLAANPSSDPRSSQPAVAAAPATAGSPNVPSASNNLSDNGAASTYPAAATEPASSGFGFGSILIGVIVIGGGIWLVSKLFKRNNAASPGQGPDFYGNRPTGPAPNFGAPNAGYPQGGNYGGGYGGQAPSSGPGIGGILATGAAAAAGAYLGNRMAGGGHDSSASNFNNLDHGTAAGFGGGAVPPANAASDYFSSRGGGATDDAGPDYFSGSDSADSSDSFFSNDTSYDDTSSGDIGGGGFDSTNDDDNSGSW